MSVIEILGLAASAVAAGAINAVAGGGTLLTFPTLLFFGTPPVVANATSTLALMIGTAGSVFGYRRHLDAVKPVVAVGVASIHYVFARWLAGPNSRSSSLFAPVA